MIDVIAEPVEKIADFESIPDGISVDTEQLEDKYNSIIRAIEEYDPKDAITALESEFRELLGVERVVDKNLK